MGSLEFTNFEFRTKKLADMFQKYCREGFILHKRIAPHVVGIPMGILKQEQRNLAHLYEKQVIEKYS